MTPTAADEAPQAAASADHGGGTAGIVLRRAREAKGLHIAALAAQLKVPQSKLEALEADRYQELPDATFARALARSVCRVLKIEAEPVLALLPRSGGEASLDRVTPGLNQPFRERAASQEPLLSPALLKSPVVLGIAGLLLAAVAISVIPGQWIDAVTARVRGVTGPATTPSAEVTPPADAASVPQSIEAPAATGTGTVTETIGVVPQPAIPSDRPASPNAAPSAVPTPAPVATAPATPATPATVAPAMPPTTAAIAPPAGASPLRVRASAESWVEVVDAQGQVLLSRLLRPGDQVDLNGVAPLKLRVGNVSGTELQFRGQPVDLAARARDNVARLELN